MQPNEVFHKQGRLQDRNEGVGMHLLKEVMKP